jgi:hypothetical protein
MTFKIKLSTGKELELTLDEFRELMDGKPSREITWIPYTPVYPSYPSQPYYVSPTVTCGGTSL